jgi:hypothetical protein
MTRISSVQRADLAFCVVSFHEQVLGCHTYIAKAKMSAEVICGYRMSNGILSAFAPPRKASDRRGNEATRPNAAFRLTAD